MRDTGTYPENLPRGECLRLMSTVGVGRIIYSRQAMPAVELVSALRLIPEPHHWQMSIAS